MTSKFDSAGFINWAVGNGDSTTIVVEPDEIIVQVDLRHLVKSEEEDDPHVKIIDELEENLPKVDGKPYLAVFVLTHPDKDHIQGFKELLKRVEIGEIWHTPRVFREFKKDLCEDAVAFKEEAERRRDITIEAGEEPKAGNRVRLIGYDKLLEEDAYEGFPESCMTVPGNSISRVNGVACSDTFEAFIHAPFKEDGEGERNDTSLAMQIELKNGDQSLKSLFLGDLKYPTIKKIFDITKEKGQPEKLEWDILLASHHCSKSVMYWKDEGEEEEKLKKDILKDFKDAARDVLPEGAYIVTSCESDFSNEEGKNPPHLKARNRYEELVHSGHFLCTHEHPNVEAPEPIQFELDEQGCQYLKISESNDSSRNDTLSEAIALERGDSNPPEQLVGFG